MPTYSYKCDECKQEWKSFHSIDEKEETCSFCQSEKISKIFSVLSNNRADGYLKLQEKENLKNRIEKFIEEARVSLKDQINETRKDYKP